MACWLLLIILWCACGQVCTAKMNLSDEVDLEDYVSRPDKISAAEVCLSSLLLFSYVKNSWNFYLSLLLIFWCLMANDLISYLFQKKILTRHLMKWLEPPHLLHIFLTL